MQILAGYLSWYGLLLGCGLAALLAHAGSLHLFARVLHDRVLQGAALTVALMLVFNYLQGYHQGRQLVFPLLLMVLAILRLLHLTGWTRAQAPLVWGLMALQLALLFHAPPISME